MLLGNSELTCLIEDWRADMWVILLMPLTSVFFLSVLCLSHLCSVLQEADSYGWITQTSLP